MATIKMIMENCKKCKESITKEKAKINNERVLNSDCYLFCKKFNIVCDLYGEHCLF